MTTNTVLARMYRQNALRDQAVECPRGNFVNSGHVGIYLRCHSATPPPAAEYDEWFEQARSSDPRGRARNKTMSGTKLRRMVVMRRQGSSFRECGTAAGITAQCARILLDKLPEGLRP